MAHNVLGWRRFCGCDKGTRSVPATVKMWWSKIPQRAESPTGVLRNPSRRKAAKRQPFVRRSTVLYPITSSYFLPYFTKTCHNNFIF